MFTSWMIQAAIFRIGILTDPLNRASITSFVWISAVLYAPDDANALPHKMTGRLLQSIEICLCGLRNALSTRLRAQHFA